MLSCLSYVAQIPTGTVFPQQQYVNGTLCLTIWVKPKIGVILHKISVPRT